MVLSDILDVDDLQVDYLEFSRTKFNPFGKINKIKAISGVSFSIRRGDIVALIGKNGAGKSIRRNEARIIDPPKSIRM